MSKKAITAKIRVCGNQKRVNIPKQEETEDWEDGELVKLERVKL